MLDLKKVIGVFLLVALLLPQVVYAQGFDVKAKSAILLDANTGQVLFNKNESLELPPASITKIMTVLLTMEAIDEGKVDLDDKVRISDFAESMGGSQIWLSAGEKVVLRDLLKAVLIPSANDATVAVAEYIGGTERNFVRMMNRKVKDLGLKHTQFVNTTGLPAENGRHYSSAHDIAVIAKELVKHEQIFTWTSKRFDYIRDGEQPLYTTNNLIGDFPGADGLKTGWTEEAGYCLAGTAKRGDLRLISVVMGTASKEARVDETIKLLNYGFNAFHRVKVINSNVEVDKIKVEKGEQLEVPVATAKSFSAIIERGTKDQIRQEVKITEGLEAPVKKGEVAGQLVFIQNERELGRVDLVTAKEVKKAGIFTLIFRWVKDFILGFFNK